MKTYIIVFIAFLSLTGLKPDKSRTISGTVYDLADKKPIAGAIVSVAGTTVSVNTAINGSYNIIVPSDKTRLVFSATTSERVTSMIFYKADTLMVGKDNPINSYLTQSGVMHIDTDSYKPVPYPIRANKATEEILRKLPGIDARDSAAAKCVAIIKVHIAGKDFFGNDAAQIKQNMPANIVQKMQVFESYGDQPMPDNNRKLLNSTLLSEDTTEFDMTAFRHDHKNNIKNILERIPCFVFDKGGELTFKGEQIVKVRIDGKDYRGYLNKMLKRTPVSKINKIQIIDDYSDCATLSFKNPGPKKVINIVTNKNNNIKSMVKSTVLAVKQE